MSLFSLFSRSSLIASQMIAGCMIAMAWLSLPCLAASAKEMMKVKEAEAAQLRQSLDSSRDSLQNDIARRWRDKQVSVERREADKEDLSRLKDAQEKAYNDLERVKEECLVKEKTAEDAGIALAAGRDEWRLTSSALDEVFVKEAEAISGAFPLDVEERQNELETVRRSYRKNQDAGAAVRDFAAYAEHFLTLGNSMGITRKTVLPDEGNRKMLTIARFGNVFGYGISDAGECYFIRQSGRLAADRYRIDKIDAAPLQALLVRSFPRWITSGSPSGMIPTDVMQNEQTKMLIAGKKITEYQKIYASFKAGGAVMIPLLLLPLWSLVLIILKLLQFGGKRSAYGRLYKKVTALLDKNDSGAALACATAGKGIVARMMETCLRNRTAPRAVIEKNMHEMFIEEIPQLSRYLNTLAVIAGAAPLLGLLGTISGMINLFGAVTHYGTGDPKFLAGGISEALITAKTGLAIAIPVLFIHDYLRNKKDRLQADIEKYVLRIVNKLWPGE
jgi:biopolymer transport protein ExbB/TolQ